MNLKSVGLIFIAASAAAYAQKLPGKMPATYYLRYKVKLTSTNPRVAKMSGTFEVAEREGTLLCRTECSADKGPTEIWVDQQKTTWSSPNYVAYTVGSPRITNLPYGMRLPLNWNCLEIYTPYKPSKFQKSQAERYRTELQNVGLRQGYDDFQNVYSGSLVSENGKSTLTEFLFSKPRRQYDYSAFKKINGVSVPTKIVESFFDSVEGNDLKRKWVTKVGWKYEFTLEKSARVVPKDFKPTNFLKAGTRVNYEGPEGLAAWQYQPGQSFGAQLAAAHPQKRVPQPHKKPKYPAKLAVATVVH